MSSREVRKLERDMIVYEAQSKAEEKFKKRLDEQEAELRRIKSEPEATEAVNKFRKKVEDSVYPEDLAKLIEEKGADEARKTHAFEMHIYSEEVASAARRAESFVKISKNLEQFDQRNADHAWLVQFIDQEEMRSSSEEGSTVSARVSSSYHETATLRQRMQARRTSTGLSLTLTLLICLKCVPRVTPKLG